MLQYVTPETLTTSRLLKMKIRRLPSTTVGNAQDINMVRTAGFKSDPIVISTSFYTAGLHTG